MTRFFIFMIVACFISSCGIYRSNFTYQDSKGVPGIAMDRVDLMIENGSIERFVGIKNQEIFDKNKDDQGLILKPKSTNVKITHFKQANNGQVQE